MLDRTFLWEMSQIRRRELLELAEVVRPRRGSVSLCYGAKARAQAWSHTLAAAFGANRLDSAFSRPPKSRPCC